MHTCTGSLCWYHYWLHDWHGSTAVVWWSTQGEWSWKLTQSRKAYYRYLYSNYTVTLDIYKHMKLWYYFLNLTHTVTVDIAPPHVLNSVMCCIINTGAYYNIFCGVFYAEIWEIIHVQLCFSIYRNSDRGKFCSNFILLWTASNACASVRQMSLAWVCGKERNQYQECTYQ